MTFFTKINENENQKTINVTSFGLHVLPCFSRPVVCVKTNKALRQHTV